MATTVPYDVPGGVKYVSKLLPVGMPASSVTRQFNSINGTKYDDTNNRIMIDLQSDCFMDTKQSYLRFRINNSSGANLRLDGSAHSVINRLRIEGPNSTELERIDQYNVLAQAMLDAQVSEDQSKTNLSCLAGTDYVQVLGPNGAFATCGVRIDNGTSKTFCIPLALSGLLSNDRYVPLSEVRGPLRIEILLENLANCFTYVTADTADFADVTIDNVAFIAQCVTFNDQFMSDFRSIVAQRGGLQWHGQTFRRVGTTLDQNATGQGTMVINERARSIKSMFSIYRPPLSTNKFDRKIGARIFPVGSGGTFSYQYRVGGKLYPSQQINVDATNVGEAYAEMLKALGLLHNITRSSSITPSSYVSSVIAQNDGAGLDTIAASGRFIQAVDFENFNGEEMESGLNTATNTLPIEVIVNRGSQYSASAGQLQVEHYMLVDCIYTLKADGMLVEAH